MAYAIYVDRSHTCTWFMPRVVYAKFGLCHTRCALGTCMKPVDVVAALVFAVVAVSGGAALLSFYTDFVFVAILLLLLLLL